MPRKPKPLADATPPPPRYQEWLTHIFDRPVSDPAWYWPPSPFDDIHFHGRPDEIAALFIHTMRHCGRDLARFSEGQIHHGLTYIVSNSCSNLVFDLKSETLGIDGRIAVLRSIETLYSDCFAARCAPVLSHFDEEGANPLNGICYMFWDISPLLYWVEDRHRALFEDVVIDVLKGALSSSNPACVESALHGFGHLRQIMGPSSPVEDIVTTFERTRPMRPELRTYALSAATGCVP